MNINYFTLLNIDMLILQIFLGILVVGGALIVLLVLITKIISPKKISKLHNSIKARNYKLAIKIARDILSKEPNNTEAHYYLGEAYYLEGRYELALVEYKAADKRTIYSKNIKESDLRERLAELYMKFDNDEEAIKEYLLLLNKNPNNYNYLYKVGELFEKKNMRDQASKYYFQSLKLKSNFVPAMVNLGVILYDTKRFTEGEKIIDRAVKMEPNNMKALFYLGLLKKSLGNQKGALKIFESTVRDKEYKVKSLTERGMILMQTGKYSDAAIELDRAIKNFEENKENLNFLLNIRYILAACYEQTRNITEAITHWEFIYSKNPNFKNVADKLSNFQELRMDDKMKDFMTATNEIFVDICKSIVTDKLNLNITEMKNLSDDGIEFVTLEGDNKWRNLRKKPKLVRIYRKSDPIDESILRSVHETMRTKEIIKGVILTSSSFSKPAIFYAQERPIELLDKTALLNLIKDFNY